MSAPLFSIVIPTRNRALLLRRALRSALEQQFTDFEIVIQANNCRDGTRELVEEFRDERIRYFETNTTLSMPDNWELAWTRARGRYVTYLPDDDALVPSALKTLARLGLDGAPAVMSWEDAPYYYPDWNDPRTRNVAVLFYYGERSVEDVPSDVYRDLCARFAFAWSSPLPKLLNCAVDRDFFERWRIRLGRLFFPVAPDYSFAWIASHVVPRIRVVHRPLTVRGISNHSIGSNAGLGRSTQEFFKEFGDFDFFGDAPLDLPLSLNHLAATFARAGHALQEQGLSVERLDRGAFLEACARQLVESRSLLDNWSDLADKLLKAAADTSNGTAENVKMTLSQPAEVQHTTESVPELRVRTARMAREDPTSLSRRIAEQHGDAWCARCTLGLERGVLAASDWQYLYLIGDELGAHDPLEISRQVDHYYDLLSECRSKLETDATEGIDDYNQQTDVKLLTALLRQLSNKIAIDVGAEHGAFVRAFLDSGAERVVAVEPFPGNVQVLRDRFGANSSVTILEAALGEQNGPATLHIAEDKTGERSDAYHSLVAFDETPTIRRVDQIEVQCLTLDSLAAEGVIPEKVGVLKIDTERSDFQIIRGMGRVTPAVIMLEYWDDLYETVGQSPYRLADVAHWLRGRGYSNFAVIKRHDEFEVVQVNDSGTSPGDWGNAIFVRDDVTPEVSQVIFSAAGESQERLVAQAQMFAAASRERLGVIDDQQKRIDVLEREHTNRLLVINELQQRVEVLEQAGGAQLPPFDSIAVPERSIGAPSGADAPGLAELVKQQSMALTRIESRLEAATHSYEQARAHLELEYQSRLEAAERSRAEAESAAVARLAVIEEQERALGHYRFWSLHERYHRFRSPRLGTLYQYPPRPIHIPKRYLTLADLPSTAPTISIVTPSLNQGAFIERTIKSVLDQSYPGLEYIVQDAVSNDDTPSILERYAPRLTYVDSRPDSGFANGINMGFTHASGEILAYLNSDDLLLPGSLHYIAQYFARNPDVDVIYGHRVIIDEYDAEIGRWVLPPHDDRVLSWADFVPQETLFWRRRVWEQVGGAIDEQFRFAIDWDLLMRFRDAGARMHRLPRFLGAFRVHPHQKTSLSLGDLGTLEMNRLRSRALGRPVNQDEVNAALATYLRKHIIYDKLYWFGMLRH